MMKQALVSEADQGRREAAGLRHVGGGYDGVVDVSFWV
jgi:hypothetical protein